MGEGRRSLVGMFALSFVLLFFVERPIHLSWGGVEIPERYVWVCLLLAQLYFTVVAYTQGVFSGVDTGGDSLRAFLGVTGKARHDRYGQVLQTYGAVVFWVLTWLMIAAGTLQAYYCTPQTQSDFAPNPHSETGTQSSGQPLNSQGFSPDAGG